MWDLYFSSLFSQRSTSWCRLFLSPFFTNFRSDPVRCVYLHAQVDDYILQRSQVLWVTVGKTRQVKLATLHSSNCSTSSPSTARWRMCTTEAAMWSEKKSPLHFKKFKKVLLSFYCISCTNGRTQTPSISFKNDTASYNPKCLMYTFIRVLVQL